MISSLAVLSVLTTAVFAQSSSSSAASASSTSSPLIPSGISTTCKSFLESLDSNSNLAACTKALATATDAYAPGNSSSTSSSSAITSVLNSISSNSCDESIMSTTIANFGSACQTELVTSPVKAVVLLYDTVYMMNPWLDVLVTKDDSGTYCVLESYNAATNSTSSSASASGYNNAAAAGSKDFDELNKYLLDQSTTPLSRRAQTVVATPNATTWTTNGIPFLFFTSSLSSSTLCTTCSRNVMTAWISWESKVPYAPAAKESALLSGLNDLYSAIQTKCGKSFLSGAVTAAGGLGTSDAARVAASRKSLVGFVLGLAGLAVASVFL